MDADRYFVRSLGCQWIGPEYDPLDPKHRLEPTPYCGCKELHGDSVYCTEHYPQVYSKGTALRKRHKDLRKAKQIAELQQMILDIAEELEDEGWQPAPGWEAVASIEE